MLADLRKSLYEVPLNQTLGVVPVVIAPGEVAIELPYRPALLDHAGAVHTASLFGVAELAAGVVLATHPSLEAVELRRTCSTIRYAAPSFGDVIARAAVSDDDVASILSGSDSASELTVQVRVHDAVDQDVARVECRFAVGAVPAP